MPAGRPSKYSDAACAIYVLREKGGAVRYVGKTKNPTKRLDAHKHPGRKNRTPVAEWSRGLRERGGGIEMEVLFWTEDWDADERRLIREHKGEGANLLNVTGGGRDALHLTEARGRYPNYIYALKFCARRGLADLADGIRATMDRAFDAGGRDGALGYDRHLREIIKDGAQIQV